MPYHISVSNSFKTLLSIDNNNNKTLSHKQTNTRTRGKARTIERASEKDRNIEIEREEKAFVYFNRAVSDVLVFFLGFRAYSVIYCAESVHMK